MKHLYRSSALAAGLVAGSCATTTREPEPEPEPASAPAAQPVSAPAPHAKLFSPWQGPHGGVPPWDATEDAALFVPAIEDASKALLAEVRIIADNPTAPTFENTLVALEKAGKPLQRVATLFFTLASSRATPEIQKASGVIRPKIAEVQDVLNFDPALYARVKAVYDAREALAAPEKRLVEKVHDSFVRRGANLDAEQKKRMGEINQRLAQLFTSFGNRVLADEDTWIVLGEEDLGGLPPALASTYAAAAKKREVEGWVVVNTRSAVDPFLTFSDNRPLREKIWRAFTTRGDHGDENDTNALIQEIVKLRAERAKLLGYASHAHWRMADTMAEDPDKAMALMMKVWPAAKAKVNKEVQAMRRIAKRSGQRSPIEPWDYRYFMEKVRKAKYALDQNEFKNYFELENMVEASYFMANRLYGFSFKEITGTVPVFHGDQRVFEVTGSEGEHVGLFYRDDFARQYKRSGAWMSNYREQSSFEGKVTAIVSNNNNFTKAGEGQPILISLDDAETLFHEFGHALHGLLNDTPYPTLANTPRDFVEFPSQVHENWVLTRAVLDKYARHYETGEAMPQALIDKMRAAATYNQGFATVEYLAAAIVDMKLHMDPSGEVDPKAFEKDALAAIGMPKEIVLRHRLPHFLHLFSSDAYSAGYYSYLWSDVMAADAWKAFEETGDPWDPAVAEKFARIILASGDAIDRAEAYRQFRGRDPKVEALIENRGL